MQSLQPGNHPFGPAPERFEWRVFGLELSYSSEALSILADLDEDTYMLCRIE